MPKHPPMHGAVALAEVDHLRLRLANEQAARFQLQAEMAAAAARGAAAALEQERVRLVGLYDIRGGDQIDIDTGAITRRPPAAAA